MVGQGTERKDTLEAPRLRLSVSVFHIKLLEHAFGNWRNRSREIRRYERRLDKIPE